MHGEITPFHDYIGKHLPTTTLATIHQCLRDKHGLTVSVSSLRRYVRAEFAEETAAERATVLRDDPPPGQEAQLDYGHLGSWLDPESGARRRDWGFIITQSEFLAAHEGGREGGAVLAERRVLVAVRGCIC